jgi:hypothetical protein
LVIDETVNDAEKDDSDKTVTTDKTSDKEAAGDMVSGKRLPSSIMRQCGLGVSNIFCSTMARICLSRALERD